MNKTSNELFKFLDEIPNQSFDADLDGNDNEFAQRNSSASLGEYFDEDFNLDEELDGLPNKLQNKSGQTRKRNRCSPEIVRCDYLEAYFVRHLSKKLGKSRFVAL